MSLAETESVAVSPRPLEVSERVAVAAVPASAPVADRRARAAWWLDGRGFVVACVLADLAVLTLATLVAAGGPSSLAGDALLALVPPLSIALLAARGTYSRTIGSAALDAIARLLGAIAIAALAVEVLAIHAGGDVADGRVLEAAALGAAGVALGRTALIAAQRHARSRRGVGRPTLIVGSGVVAERIARRLTEDARYGLRPVGFVDDPLATPFPQAIRMPQAIRSPLPRLGGLAQLCDVAARTGAEHVIVAFSGAARDDVLSPLVRDCERRGLAVSIVPRLFESVNGRLTYERLGGLPLIGLHAVDPSSWRFAAKHAIDVVAASLALVILAPLLLAIAMAVRLDSPGPVLFRQRRVGRDGRHFDLLKFRSMRVDPVPAAFVPPAGGAPGGVEGQDRRTRVGRLLRRSSLDELPQLVNVLRGDMSLIGPRPERPEFVELFEGEIPRYEERHRVRSGVTGWAQVHGYRGQTSLADRVEWDNYYIEHWSFGLDLRILLMTFVVLFRPSED